MLQQLQQLQYFDPEIKGLKAEIAALEYKLNNVSNEKADLEKLIHDFYDRYNRELGDLILKLLERRKNNAKGTPEQADADEDYENFYRQFETTLNEFLFSLTKDELLELKANYRKASKLCHPDVVCDEQKAEATQLFAELSNAYSRNDLATVNEILFDLQHGIYLVRQSETINDKHQLRIKIHRMKKRLKQLIREVATIKRSAAYFTVKRINDWDAYFEKRKNELQSELNRF